MFFSWYIGLQVWFITSRHTDPDLRWKYLLEVDVRMVNLVAESNAWALERILFGQRNYDTPNSLHELLELTPSYGLSLGPLNTTVNSQMLSFTSCTLWPDVIRLMTSLCFRFSADIWLSEDCAIKIYRAINFNSKGFWGFGVFRRYKGL